MAVAIGFKKVSSLPASPISSSFYFVNDEDLYLGDRKLNNDDDLAALVTRVEALEGSSPGSGGGGGVVAPTSADKISIADTGNNFVATNVEDALAELAGKIGSAGGKFEDFSLLRLSPADWATTPVTDGGRQWYTATIGFVRYDTNIIHAIPCGNTLGDMPTEEEEKCVYAMKGYLYPDDKNIIFYSPVIPSISVVIAVEGVTLSS